MFVTLNHGPLNKVAKDCPCLNTKIFLFKFFFKLDDVDTNHASHPWGIFFTVLGTVLLDFDADACQSPSRAYLLDVTLPGKGSFKNYVDKFLDLLPFDICEGIVTRENLPTVIIFSAT